MYYIIDDDEDRKFDSVDEVCDYIFDTDNYDDDDAVEEWVDEIYPSVDIAGTTFSASQIVRELDSYLWSDLCHEWAESQSESDSDYYYHDIECLEAGEEQWFNNFKVRAVEENEEEDEEDTMEAFNSILQTAYVVKTLSDSPASVQVLR